MELTVVMIVLGVLSVGALSGGAGWVEEWQKTSTRQDALSEASTALNRMVREIREFRDRGSTAWDSWWDVNRWARTLRPPNVNQISFINTQNQAIGYLYNPAQRVVTRQLGTGTDPLVWGAAQTIAQNVTAFSFRYFRSDLQELSSVWVSGIYTDLRLVRIQFTIGQGNENVTVRSAVAPINLQME